MKITSEARSLRLSTLLLALLLTGVLGACGERTAEPPEEETAPGETPAAETGPVEGGTLVIARAADTTTLDPAQTFEGESTKVVGQIFDGLVNFAPGSTDVEPGLATSWEASDDGRTWTFHLREGVTFHDGTPFDAEAVLFSIRRQMDPEHPFHQGQFNTWENTFAGHIVGIEAVDPMTVEVRLREPFAPIVSGFAVYSMAIVSPAAMREMGVQEFSKNPVGTGPFRFVEWVPEDRLTLEANDEYWGGAPHLDRVVFRTVPDPDRRATLLERGEAHVGEGFSQTEIRRLSGDQSLEIRQKPGLNTGYLAFNTTRRPFDDPRIRRAVSMGFDSAGLVRSTYQDLGVTAKSYLPPTLWGYNEQLEPFRQDLDRARNLLREAGYGDSFSFTLDVMKNPRPYMPQPVKLAEGIQAGLQKLGIQVEIRANEWNEHLERTVRSPEADYDACLLGWLADMPDPNDFLYVQFHSDNANLAPGRTHQNISLYENPELDRLVEQAQGAPSREQRTELYRRAQEIVREDVPLMPLAHSFIVIVQRNEVEGLSVPTARSNFGLPEAWLEPAEEGADVEE
ncbi:MAG: ABC transporter substrate-binding protein, partial [Thermoanaerobaculia bacterium]|nr:ABC transporter substrate-binding protein [Thermoanaerobaculia bacterium]